MNYSPNSRERERESKSKLIWIILGIVLIIGLICGIYFFTKSNNSPNQPTQNPDNPLPNPSNVQYLPSEEEAQTKINQIQQDKGLDQQQATIEFLTQYVPHIKWWEINSLSELDEKIKLVNSKTGFSPFKEIPEVNKFNQEVAGNMMKKSLIMLASIIPREDNGTIDWKGTQDFATYFTTYLEPLSKDRKYKPVFATQANYQELSRRLKEEINPNLINTWSSFPTLSQVSELNGLTNNYLGKIFQGCVYADIHKDLAKQLAISSHKQFIVNAPSNESKTYIENKSWNIALSKFAFEPNEVPNPDPNPTPTPNPETPTPQPSNNPVIKEFQEKAQEIKELLKPCEELVKSLEEVKKTKEELKEQLEEKRKGELDPDGKDNLTSLKTKTQISSVELEILKIDNDGFSGGLSAKPGVETIRAYLDNFTNDIKNFENESEYEQENTLSRWKSTLSDNTKNRVSKIKEHLEDFYNGKKWEK